MLGREEEVLEGGNRVGPSGGGSKRRTQGA